MTTQQTSSLSVRQDRRLIRPNTHSKRFVLAEIVAPARHDASEAARRSISRSSSIARAPCPATSCASRSRRQRRPSAGFRPATGSASSSTTTSSRPSSNSTHASAESRRAAVERLRSIEARGSTNLAEGWLRGCEQLARHQLETGRQSVPAPDRRPRQRRRDEPDRRSRPMPPNCGRGGSRHRRSASATTSMSGSCRSLPTPAADTSTTSPTRRRSATPSPPKSVRRSRSWLAT